MCFPKSLYEEQLSTKEPRKALQDKHNVFNECLQRTQIYEDQFKYSSGPEPKYPSCRFRLGRARESSETDRLSAFTNDLCTKSEATIDESLAQ
jgi:hypothetical protein